jgi:hypothetical protein
VKIERTDLTDAVAMSVAAGELAIYWLARDLLAESRELNVLVDEFLAFEAAVAAAALA